jgi:acyl carrier protein
MTKLEFFHALEESIGAASDSIRGNESLKDLDGWDSMAAVDFMAMADERLGILVEPSQLAACKTASDLAALFPGKIS